MEWRDEGVVVSTRRHGESSAVVCLFTHEHGRHSGLARGISNKRNWGLYQLGNEVSASWRGRLGEHLGTLTCELTDARAARLIEDQKRLEALASVCSLLEAALPERHPYPELYSNTVDLLREFDANGCWLSALILWELQLLAELGFGLDLSSCALTGEKNNLAYVSPRTGRAVTSSAGSPYRDKLLVLPKFAVDSAFQNSVLSRNDIAAGLKLTGWFISRHLLSERKIKMPAARGRLAKRWEVLP